jgi:hypothetical protein
MGVWSVCAFFCVCVVLCLGRGLATSWSPVQGVLPYVKWSRNWEISPVLQSGSKLQSRSKRKNICVYICIYVYTHKVVILLVVFCGWNMIPCFEERTSITKSENSVPR